MMMLCNKRLKNDINMYTMNNLNKEELKITLTNYNGCNYQLCKYIKTCINANNIHTLGHVRSLITCNEQVVCTSPSKSLPLYDFINSHPNLDTIMFEEFVEGTMINAFYHNNEWIISTKSVIGAKTVFFDKKPRKNFDEMFYETGVDLNILDKSYCYSFVLQHPCNRIVIPMFKPKLYLVAVYSITDDNTVRYINGYHVNCDKIYYPKKYNFNSYDDAIHRFSDPAQQYDSVGVMITDTLTGERTKIRNPKYEYVRKLKGNSFSTLYRYIELRRQKLVGEYLKYFPEDKHSFYVYSHMMNNFSETMLAYYHNCYVKKCIALKDIPQNYKTNIFLLHKVYLEHRKEFPEQKFIVKLPTVINFINKLDIPLIISCLKTNE